jgi:hypothetical protein
MKGTQFGAELSIHDDVVDRLIGETSGIRTELEDAIRNPRKAVS